MCESAFEGLRTLLGEVGLGLRDLVRTILCLSDYADFGALNVVYGRYLSAPGPVRTAVQVANLPLNAAVQADAVVAFP